MMQQQKMVLDFHKLFERPVCASPSTKVSPKLRKLRETLMKEELGELIDAMKKKNLVKIADGIVDLMVVTLGTANTYGLDVEEFFEEIHYSNMSKGDPEVIIRKDGKILKGKNWLPPELEPILAKQMKQKRLQEWVT